MGNTRSNEHSLSIDSSPYEYGKRPFQENKVRMDSGHFTQLVKLSNSPIADLVGPDNYIVEIFLRSCARLKAGDIGGRNTVASSILCCISNVNVEEISPVVNSKEFDHSLCLAKPDNEIIEIVLYSCKDLKPADIGGKSDPFVRFSLINQDEKLGQQVRYSSFKSRTLNPYWAPPESFKFLVDRQSSNRRLLISVLDHDHTIKFKKHDALGDCVIDLSNYKMNSSETKTVSLRDSSTGNERGSITFEIYVLDLEKGTAQTNDLVYEFERWAPFKGWSKDNLKERDLGPFTNGDQSVSSLEFHDCVSPIKEGYKKIQDWAAVTHDKSEHGWQYAFSSTSLDWFDREAPFLSVRRKVYRRITIDPRILQDEEVRGL
eukprot:CAMPEP_0117881430 /NCGR_PEP_ID=MMETSP0950-20121206/16817_1 /TAXON_ID=44440 /ORGANISM="Chattonella subsalsa, Strain CCMP2191" /LENGTH=373 /DNA_ID=CAMNT_0005736679 /DNA_START=112 /DNA_END=1233 /DNA_ORIENTATION=+